MLSEQRSKFREFDKKIGEIFSQPGLTANHYTFLALILSLFCFYFLSKVNLGAGLFFFAGAAVLDLVDGAVARYTKKASPQGAYLDTVFDRYVEGIILLGLISLPLSPLFLPAKVWIFLSFLGSLMTTYSKAAAKEKGLVQEELKAGFVGRGERMILIFLSFVLGIINLSWMLYPIIVLAILSNFTAFQRVFLALHPTKSQGSGPS